MKKSSLSAGLKCLLWNEECLSKRQEISEETDALIYGVQKFILRLKESGFSRILAIKSMLTAF
jgi:hypothetical protein